MGGSEEPAVVPYDYDQEHVDGADPGDPADRAVNLVAEPSPATPEASPPPDQEVAASTTASEPAGAAAETPPAEPETEPAPPAAEPVSSFPAPVHTAAPEPAAAETAAPEASIPEPAAPGVPVPEETIPEAALPEQAPAAREVPPRPAAAPKHAMRSPSIGGDATELLNGSKPAPRELPRIIAIANQKGGVGKTTTTVNLGAALAELDYRVLVIDLDPQGNATTGLGVEARNFEHSMYDVIMRDLPLEDAIEPTSVKNLFVAPATIDLAGVEIELVPAFSRELKLKRAIDSVVDDFDFVIIDCPPSLGLITVNGLAAADEVLVPIQCEYYALEGLSQLLRNVNLVSTNLNQTLEVSTIVLTMYDARTRLSVDVANEVREHFSERVCRAVIPRTVRLSEAPSFGQPITVFDPTSRGAVAYRELAKEVSNGAPQRSR
jgi:chromosome partitioning protein